MMISPKLLDRVHIALVVLTLGLNAAAYPFLPAQVGMQMSLEGELRNPAPKLVYVMVAPAILLLTYVLAKSKHANTTLQHLLAGGILFAANLALLYMNLR